MPDSRNALLDTSILRLDLSAETGPGFTEQASGQLIRFIIRKYFQLRVGFPSGTISVLRHKVGFICENEFRSSRAGRLLCLTVQYPNLFPTLCEITETGTFINPTLGWIYLTLHFSSPSLGWIYTLQNGPAA